MKPHVALIVLLVMGCGSDLSETVETPDLNNIPDQESWNATLISSQNGVTSNKIHYAYMKGYSEQHLIEFLDGLRIEFYDNGEPVSQIRAQRAKLNDLTSDIQLMGDVVVTSSDSVKLFTQKLDFNETTGRIITDDPVMFINAENDTIYGAGFESEKSLQNWEIVKPTGTTQKRLKLEVVEEK